MTFSKFDSILGSYSPITLEEMASVILMDRFDTKYVLSAGKITELITRLKGSYRVLEINNERSFKYSTTYFDTDEYLFFNHHVTGKLERNKVRFRKYESTGKSFLEVKRRTNKNRTIKWRIENDCSNGSKLNEDAQKFISGLVPLFTNQLKPVLHNNFRRITLVDNELSERITIDYEISFSGHKNGLAEFPFMAVIELKRKKFTTRSKAEYILRELSVRASGFSKYCIGAAMFYDIPRKNALKPKFLLINKIKNEYYGTWHP